MALKTVIRLSDQAAGFITNSSASTTYATKASPTFSGSVSFLDSASFYYDGTARDTLFLNNNNITGVGNVSISDPGPGEGISWAGGNLWKIYESPDALTNGAGNLQFVQNATRRLTIDATTGDVTTQKSLYIGDERTTTEQTTLHIGAGRTGNGYAYIDLVGDTGYPDYGARFLRGNSGSNTLTQILHKGTGALQITAVEAGSIALGTSNTSRLVIDSAGKITMPAIPAVYAFSNVGSSITDDGVLPFNSVVFNNGSHYNASTSTFTAPVTGRYLVMCKILTNNDSGAADSRIAVNGSRLSSYAGYAVNSGVITSHKQGHIYGIVNLSANDTIQIRAQGTVSFYSNATTGHSSLNIHLIG
jgi:hypothetical protein